MPADPAWVYVLVRALDYEPTDIVDVFRDLTVACMAAESHVTGYEARSVGVWVPPAASFNGTRSWSLPIVGGDAELRVEEWRLQ